VLEGYAVRLALERMTDDEYGELQDIVEEMCERARAGDGEGVSRLDILFHKRLYEFSDHQLLGATLYGLRRKIGMLVTIDRELTQDLVQLAENHRMLLDTLRTGNPAAAEDLFREHIVEVGDALVARMQEASEAEAEKERSS